MSNMLSSQKQSHQDGEIDLSMMLNQLWANRWRVLLIMSITLLLGVYYASKQVPVYQSEVLLKINPEQGGGVIGILSQQLNMGKAQYDSEATQISLITSRFILAPVVKSLGLDISAVPKQSRVMRVLSPSNARVDVKYFDVPPREINKPFTLAFDQSNHFRLYNSTGNVLLDGEIGKLAMNQDKSIRLQIDSKPTSPTATFTLTKISDAKIIKSLQQQLRTADLGTTRQNTGVLALTLNNPDPETAVRILNEVAKTIQAKDIQENAMEASKTLEFLYQQIPITKMDLEKSEAELNRYRAQSGKINIKLQGDHLLKQLSAIDAQLGKARIDKINKLQRYTAEHPLIIALNTKIRELKSDREELEIKLKKLPAADQIAVSLMRDVKVKNSLYTVLLKKIQELQVVKAGIISDVRILSLAKVADDPLPRQRRLIYVVSLLFGLLLSIGVIFARKVISPRVDDPHWTERYFDLVNLAIIPYSKEQFLNAGHSKGRTLKQLPLLAHTSPRNLAIESLRSLRTTMQIRLSSETNNIVSILGVSPAVGKTFVSANLAYLLAMAGKRVVVIDTDMRRGTLHKYYNLTATPGLAEILNNKVTLTESLRTTAHTNLMVLPRGIYPKDPSELLTSKEFQDVLTMLSQQFDIVLIDTPPVLLVTDAVLISVHAGTNYLVLGAGAHQPTEIEVSIKRLNNAGVTLDGTIFNFHEEETVSKNGYGYKYGYKYGYYYDDKETTK